MRKLFLCGLLIYIFLLNVGTQTVTPNCSNPIFSVASFASRNQTRPRYLDTPATSNLSYCKLFNNKTSCCNKTTDDDISAIFANYKAVLSNATSKKFRSIKEGFEGYENISYGQYANADKAKEKVGKVLADVKEKLAQTTRNAVACARHALKLSAGLLCSGCNPMWGGFVKMGKFVFSENSCLALSNACYGLLRGFDNLKNESRSDISNLTDAITEFVGEPLSPAEENLVNNETDPARILQGSRAGILAKIKSWASKGYVKESDCTICYDDDPGEFTSTAQKPNCKDNVIIKLASDAFKAANPDKTEPNAVALGSHDYVKGFQIFSRYYVLPINVSLDAGSNSWGYYTEDADFNKIAEGILALKNDKARAARIKTYNDKVAEEFAAFVKIYTLVNDNNYLILSPLLTDAQSKKNLQCYRDAVKTLLNETSKKPFDVFRYDVALTGADSGKITGENAPTVKSKIPESLNACVKQEMRLETFKLISNKDFVIFCQNIDCMVFLQNAAPMPPATKTKDEKVNSFQDIKKKGGDPKRISPATGRKVPEDIILPNNTDAATEMAYEPPCANVSHCAKWFCNNFLSGPFAKVEKVLNPQNSSDSLDSLAGDAYKTELNTTKRVLAEEQNELSSTGGLNFIAVAEATGLSTTVAVDGIQEEAAGFDSSIKANTTLDSNSQGTVPNNNTNNGGNGGNGAPRINMIFSVIVAAFIFVSLI